MNKILQIIGFISLLLIAFVAGLMTNTSITFIDSEEDLIAEISEIDNSPEINDVPEIDSIPDVNYIPKIDSIPELKEPG